MITKFKVNEERRLVTWEHDGGEIEFVFQYPVYANHIEQLDEVIIHSSVQESGERNLALYRANGSLKARPDMPKLANKVEGVYAVYFGQGKKQVPVVLLCEEYKPYDTGCTFDLETHKFLKFHPTL